jgi:hypothetical protein
METDARRRADMIGSSFRTSEAIRHYLSESCRVLVGKLVDLYGEDYYSESTTVSTAASTPSTALPTGAWKLLKLRVTLNGERVTIDRASVDDLDSEGTYTGWLGGVLPTYRQRGSNLVWFPVPTAVHVVTLEYVPTAIFRDSSANAVTELTSANDTFDGIFGWELWPVLHTAIKLKTDNGKDANDLRLELAELEADMLRAAMNRSADAPKRVRTTWGVVDDDLA